jgi:hypothetical protein
MPIGQRNLNDPILTTASKNEGKVKHLKPGTPFLAMKGICDGGANQY